MKKYLGMIAFIMLVMMPAAHAGKIYLVDREIGQGYVSGYITTDGTIGILDVDNIIDYSLNMFAPNMNSGVVVSSNYAIPMDGVGAFQGGNAVTATSNDLLFDFDKIGYWGFFADSDFIFWCLAGGNDTECDDDFKYGELLGKNQDIAQYVGYFGVVSFATAAELPGPGTFALLSLGLAAFGLRRRRSVKAKRTSS